MNGKTGCRMTIRSALCGAALLSIGAASAAAQGYDPRECVRQLQQHGLTPVLQGRVTDSLSPFQHLACRNQGMYTPLQVSACMNARTGAVAYAGWSSPSLMATCKPLMQKDPSWDVITGYVCCVGYNIPLSSLRVNRQRPSH